jgi:autophagy-related protein 16
MDDLYNLIQERNSRETLPFLSIHSSNAYLRNLVDSLQGRYEWLERQYLEQQQIVAEQQQAIELSINSAPTKVEARLREQIAKLQGDLRERIQNEVKYTADAIEASDELSKSREENAAQGATISNLRTELARCNEIIVHLQSELENSKSLASLADKQTDGLKDAIRSLQEENEEVTKLNKRLVDETVSDKERMADQLNNMNTTIECQQKEVNMLRSYAKMGKGQIGGLFRGLLGDKNLSASNADNSKDPDETPKRQWGENTCAVLPSQPLYIIKAHRDDASCVRYDGTNLNRVATASSDATVRVFDTSNGQLEATFSAGGRLPLIGVDIGGDIVCGCGADKTCRVWQQQTKRMIHQLAGHSQKITCVRLFPCHKYIITGSADRSMRLWDISRHIYTQTTTFRHSSTSNCIDVSSETNSAVSGHLDGNYSDVVFTICSFELSFLIFCNWYIIFRWNSLLGCADRRPCIRYTFTA